VGPLGRMHVPKRARTTGASNGTRNGREPTSGGRRRGEASEEEEGEGEEGGTPRSRASACRAASEASPARVEPRRGFTSIEEEEEEQEEKAEQQEAAEQQAQAHPSTATPGEAKSEAEGWVQCERCRKWRRLPAAKAQLASFITGVYTPW
jgi:hypothetical protein